MIITMLYSNFNKVLRLGYLLVLTLFCLARMEAGSMFQYVKVIGIQTVDTLVVDNNLDEGEGSLRQAILFANALDKRVLISVRLGNNADSVLTLKSPLPGLQGKIRVEVTDAVPVFILDGIDLTESADHGIRIQADSVGIEGLTIRNFPGYGILCLSDFKHIDITNNIIENNGRLNVMGGGLFLQNAGSVMISSNIVRNNLPSGIELKHSSHIKLIGNQIYGNQGDGLWLDQCEQAVVGDSCDTCENLIHSNLLCGIRLTECVENIHVYNNLIGINRETTLPLPNGQHGILMRRCKNVFVGDRHRENIISGNMINGISVIDSSSSVFIRNNKIGYTNYSNFGIANRQKGIEVLGSRDIQIGGKEDGEGNKIGYSQVNIYAGDSSEQVSIIHNQFFCSPFSILIEHNSNGGLLGYNEFEILNARRLTGQFLPGGNIQIYRKRKECMTCQGNELLASVQATPIGIWDVLLDIPLQHGDFVSLILTDTLGNSYGFTPCKQFNCVVQQNVNILSNGTDRLCEGDQLVLSTSFGTLHQWSTGETNAQIQIDTGGWYSVRVIDTNGCSTSDSLYIQYFPSPSLTLYPSDSAYICDKSVILRAFGQGAFVWNTGVYGPVVEVSSEGTYCVSLTNQFQCTSTDCVTLMQGDSVDAQITLLGDPTICQGDSVILIATGGSNFEWSTGEIGSDRITVFDSGLYKVTVSNPQGCTDVATQLVEVLPGVVATIDQPEYIEICHGDTITMTAGGGKYYFWSTGSSSRQIRVSKTGIYDVFVSNEYGCTDRATCIVSVLPAFQSNITTTHTVLCKGDTLVFQPHGAILDSLVWSHGQKGYVVNFDRTGYYIASLYKYGCSIEQTFFIRVDTPPVIDSITGNKWVGPNTFAEYQVHPADESSMYFWRVSGGRIIDQSKPGYVLVEWFGEPGSFICATEQSATGCMGDEKCIEIQIVSGTEQTGETYNVKVYPNPAKSLVFVELAEALSFQDLEIGFFDNHGKLLKTVDHKNKEKQFSIDISDLQGGVYQMHFSCQTGWETWIKLVIISMD